jgi:hypothetical protein
MYKLLMLGKVLKMQLTSLHQRQDVSARGSSRHSSSAYSSSITNKQNRLSHPQPSRTVITISLRFTQIQISETSQWLRFTPVPLRRAAQATRSSKPPQLFPQASGNMASTRTYILQYYDM